MRQSSPGALFPDLYRFNVFPRRLSRCLAPLFATCCPQRFLPVFLSCRFSSLPPWLFESPSRPHLTRYSGGNHSPMNSTRHRTPVSTIPPFRSPIPPSQQQLKLAIKVP